MKKTAVLLLWCIVSTTAGLVVGSKGAEPSACLVINSRTYSVGEVTARLKEYVQQNPVDLFVDRFSGYGVAKLAEIAPGAPADADLALAANHDGIGVELFFFRAGCLVYTQATSAMNWERVKAVVYADQT